MFVYVVTNDCCQVKCHAYYPTGSENEGEDAMEFDDVGLKVTYVEEKESNMHYTARVFYITDTEVQSVSQTEFFKVAKAVITATRSTSEALVNIQETRDII